MPRNVRNFWLELKVDGKRSTVAIGPVRKDGGFELRVLMRNRGGIVDTVSMWGHADENGVITLHVKPERAAFETATVSHDRDSFQLTVRTER